MEARLERLRVRALMLTLVAGAIIDRFGACDCVSGG